MKSRFYLAILIAGVFPLAGAGGFYVYSLMSQAGAAPKVSASAGNPSAGASLPQLQAGVQTIASSILSAVNKTDADLSSLAAHNKTADLDAFIHSHPGVTGVVILSREGKVARSLSTPPIADASYVKNPEFQKVLNKFKETGNKTYQFYTNRLGYPAFIFAMPIGGSYFVEAALSLGHFFQGIENQKGDFFILEAGSGKYLYHSNSSKILTAINPASEAWLTQVQTDLSAQKSGLANHPPDSAAVYGYLFGKLGVVHVVPLAALAAAPSKPLPPPELMDLLFTPVCLAFMIAFAWLCLAATIASRVIFAPLRRAAQVAHAAADDSAVLTPEVAQSFGSDEVGQVIQAIVSLNQKSQDKDASVKHAAEQIEAAQQQTRRIQGESQEKVQALNDKLKELDALKGMSEGLRNQAEQAREENAKLKNQLSEERDAKNSFEKKLSDTQGLLKTAEAKALQAAGAASAVQVSQSRAAAIRTMSEELKNTLGIIKGYVSSMLGVGQGGINEKQQEFLGMVINRSARLEKFINDLVDIYQVEIEQQDAKTEEINLAVEIEGLAFNFQPQAEVKNLKIKVDAKPNLPKVPIVRRRFNQLWNIIYLQVIKDAPKGSSVTIAVESSGDNVKVTVLDPGMTVAPESLPRLFDEFYDPKHPASPQLAGTGLKFALVKTILSVYGGGATAEKADPGTKLILNFSTKKKMGGTVGTAAVSAPSAAPSLGAAPAAKPAALSTPSAPPAAAPPGISLGTKSTAPSPPPSAGPAAGPGILDALIAGKIPPVTAPGIKAPPPPITAAPSASSSAPAVPVPPASAPPGLKPPPPPIPAPSLGPKPMGPLDALLSQKAPAPPIAPGALPPPKPAAPIPPPPPAAPPAGAPKPYIAPGSLDALLGGSAPPPPKPGGLPE